MINYVINPLISLKKAFMAAACAASYVAEKVAVVICPADRQQEYDSCRHNSQKIREYVLRITEHPDDEAYHIAEFWDHIGDYHSPYHGYPRLMECFENMVVSDQGESSQINQLARYASAFMGGVYALAHADAGCVVGIVVSPETPDSFGVRGKEFRIKASPVLGAWETSEIPHDSFKKLKKC